jgi:hypothetical protein
MNLTPAQAQYILDTLLDSGKLRAKQVRAVLKDRRKEMATLRQRLAALERLDGASPRGGVGGTRRTRSARKPRVRTRRARLSPKTLALRRQQGRYMGFVRRLKATEKARVRAVREKQGMEAAIRLASSFAAKS